MNQQSDLLTARELARLVREMLAAHVAATDASRFKWPNRERYLMRYRELRERVDVATRRILEQGNLFDQAAERLADRFGVPPANGDAGKGD